MNDNNKEITEEALDILYSFEEPLEQHIRSKYSELNFDCILLGAIYSKTKETSEAVILVDIRFEMEEDSIKLAPLDDLKSHCKVYLENEERTKLILVGCIRVFALPKNSHSNSRLNCSSDVFAIVSFFHFSSLPGT